MTDKKRILALSSSRVGSSGYLEKSVADIRTFLGEQPLRIAFIPFAFVAEDKSPLINNVKQALSSLPHRIEEVTAYNAVETVENADAIMVSGGNTFKLLHDLYASGLLNIIKGKVKAGTPYIGWSAGANITGCTICTTNDMPIIQPKSFKSFAFFPFQINPHYYNVQIEGFNGETRDQRLAEFLMLNPQLRVVCLPEGTALLMQNGKLKLLGKVPGVVMFHRQGAIEKEELPAGKDISFLLKKLP